MIKIRNYNNTDYLQVASILMEAELYDEVWDSEKNLSGMIEKDSKSIIVAEDKNTVIGNLFIIPYGVKVSYLFRLAVRKDYRERGVGSKLIKYALRVANKRKVSEIGLYVDAGNHKLQSFYQKRGFKISKKSYYYMWNELK